MKARTEIPQLLFLIAGAATLVALSISNLPPLPEALHAPSTPFDRGVIPGAADRYRLFSAAAAVIPIGASVAPLSQPRDPVRETTLHREAVALLPGRRVLPAALWDLPTGQETGADFLIVAGPLPSPPPGTLLAELPQGSIWRRARP